MKPVTLAILVVFTVFAPASVLSAKPNILLILSDDHSVPHVGAYGGKNWPGLDLTPNLDAMAADGIRFNRAYTASPQCAPSRMAIFAGRSPVGLSVTRFTQPVRADVPFFTDVLRKNGYWVGLDGRHQHLDGSGRPMPHVAETYVELGVRGKEFESRFDHFVRNADTKGKLLDGVGKKVGAVIDSVPEGRPWFLYFGFQQPHRRWGKDHEGIDPAKLVLPPDWPDLPQVRLDYARYLADVRDLDRGMGLILEELKTRQIERDTMVIFMGDNGEALLRGKGTLATRGIHVPLLIRWPAIVKPGRVSDVLVSGVDLAPTILAAAGLEKTVGMTGISFLPELEGKAFDGRRYAFAERGWHWGPLTRSDGFDLQRSVTSRRYHFVYNAIPEREYCPVDMDRPWLTAWKEVQDTRAKGHLSELHQRLFFKLPRPIFELYDLKEDPFQLNNLAGKKAMAEIERKLRIQMDRWMVRESDYLPLPSHVRR
ncbi:MAG: sulfatase [Akkermansiaceae bacterium]|jgi:arylsulfatase A-like enzyme